MYICNLKDNRYVIREENSFMISNEMERELGLSRREVNDAKTARKLLTDMGYPPAVSMMKLLKGFMKEAPVSAHDLYNSYKLYGPHPAEVKGKYRQINPKLEKPDFIPKPVVTDLLMFADIMIIASEEYLVTITKPLGLLVVCHLADRKTAFLSRALNSMSKQYRARSFKITRILSDREGGLYKLRDALADAGIVVDPAGAGSHVGTIEVQIKLIKESFRSVLHGLPFRLPKFLYRHLVYFCIGRRNMLPSNTSATTKGIIYWKGN
jgi:hypothetical protein